MNRELQASNRRRRKARPLRGSFVGALEEKIILVVHLVVALVVHGVLLLADLVHVIQPELLL